MIDPHTFIYLLVMCTRLLPGDVSMLSIEHHPRKTAGVNTIVEAEKTFDQKSWYVQDWRHWDIVHRTPLIVKADSIWILDKGIAMRDLSTDIAVQPQLKQDGIFNTSFWGSIKMSELKPGSFLLGLQWEPGVQLKVYYRVDRYFHVGTLIYQDGKARFKDRSGDTLDIRDDLTSGLLKKMHNAHYNRSDQVPVKVSGYKVGTLLKLSAWQEFQLRNGSSLYNGRIDFSSGQMLFLHGRVYRVKQNEPAKELYRIYKQGLLKRNPKAPKRQQFSIELEGMIATDELQIIECTWINDFQLESLSKLLKQK